MTTTEERRAADSRVSASVLDASNGATTHPRRCLPPRVHPEEAIALLRKHGYLPSRPPPPAQGRGTARNGRHHG